jgi:hypothetical protein
MCVFVDASSHTYLMLKQGKKYVHLVPMKASELGIVKLTKDEMLKQKIRLLNGYPVQKAIERFWSHGCRVGMSDEVKRGLETLKASPETLEGF